MPNAYTLPAPIAATPDTDLWLNMNGLLTNGTLAIAAPHLGPGPANLLRHIPTESSPNGVLPVGPDDMVGPTEEVSLHPVYEGPRAPGRTPAVVLPSEAGSTTYLLPYPGLYAVLSAAGVGKTLLAREISRAANIPLFLVGEPEPGSGDANPRELAYTINHARHAGQKAFVLDSLLPLSFGGGAAAAGGVSRSLFEAIIGLTRYARITETYIIAVVNLVADEEVINRSYIAVKGAATGVWDIQDSSPASRDRVALTVTWSVRPQREPSTAKILATAHP